LVGPRIRKRRWLGFARNQPCGLFAFQELHAVLSANRPLSLRRMCRQIIGLRMLAGEQGVGLSSGLAIAVFEALSCSDVAHNASMPPGDPGEAIHTITGDSSVARVDPSDNLHAVHCQASAYTTSAVGARFPRGRRAVQGMAFLLRSTSDPHLVDGPRPTNVGHQRRRSGDAQGLRGLPIIKSEPLV
jgi:hypothetical protein